MGRKVRGVNRGVNRSEGSNGPLSLSPAHPLLAFLHLMPRSKIYSSMASIELPDVSAEDAFDFLSHHENNSLWHKNVCEVEIDPESSVKWGLGTKYLHHGKIAFLPSYKTTRYMTVTKFDSSSTTKVMEQTEVRRDVRRGGERTGLFQHQHQHIFSFANSLLPLPPIFTPLRSLPPPRAAR